MNRYEMSVFLACAELHGHLTGSGPQLDAETMHRLQDWLNERLVYWVQSKPAHEKYDEAVRALIVATIQEATHPRPKKVEA
jgi:uncharacterized protein YgfB (UPF0149 family)